MLLPAILLPTSWRINPLTIWLGRTNYSLYFVHFAVLLGLDYAGYADMLHPTRMRVAVADFVLRFLLVLACSGLLAAICYRFISLFKKPEGG